MWKERRSKWNGIGDFVINVNVVQEGSWQLETTVEQQKMIRDLNQRDLKQELKV